MIELGSGPGLAGLLLAAMGANVSAADCKLTSWCSAHTVNHDACDGADACVAMDSAGALDRHPEGAPTDPRCARLGNHCACQVHNAADTVMAMYPAS